MKTLLLIGTLLGGFFATNDTAQEYAIGAWDHARGMFQHEAITEEEDALRTYISELMLDYSEEGLTEEEIATQRAEYISLIEAKAAELGVTLNIDFDLFAMFDLQGEMILAHEDMEQLMDYYQELIAGYDFSTMTEEEIAAAQADIQALLEEKAAELGIDVPFIGGMTPYGDVDNFGGMGGHGHRPGGHMDGFNRTPYDFDDATDDATDTTTDTTETMSI